jgi:hypothetical protein
MSAALPKSTNWFEAGNSAKFNNVLPRLWLSAQRRYYLIINLLINICPEFRRIRISMERRMWRRMKRVKTHTKQGPQKALSRTTIFPSQNWSGQVRKRNTRRGSFFRNTADYFWGLKNIVWLFGGRDRRSSSKSPAFGENVLSFTVRIRSLHHLINTSCPRMFEGDPHKVRFTWAYSVLPHECRPGVFKYASFQMYTHSPFVIIFHSYWTLYSLRI